jgi:photosystem II stability/assembly factor-like uncharacterized protein
LFSLTFADDRTLLTGGYDGVWRSTDGGQWVGVDTGLSVGESFAVASGGNGAVYSGVKGGAFRSDDAGRSWVDVSAGIDAGNTFGFCFTRDGSVLAGTDDGIRVLAPGGGNWDRAGLDGYRVFSILEPAPGVLVCGTLGDGIQRRGADGAWQNVNGDIPHRMAYDLMRSPISGDVFVAMGDVASGEKTGGIYRSSDLGLTWRPAGHDPISVYRVVETASGAIFGGAQRTCILRSKNGGASWDATRPSGLVESKMYCMIVDAQDRVFVGSGAQLLRTEDLGETWQVIGRGLDGVTVYALSSHPSGTLLASTTAGMYWSDDAGLTFHPAPWPS